MKLNILLLSILISIIETSIISNLSNYNQKIQLQMSSKQHQVKKIKKMVDDQERWFEEIFEYYEEVIYEYDELDPDELSLGSQMDLEHLIENYDIPEDCYEENISLYEYYDVSEEFQNNNNNKNKTPNQKIENENNFQVYNLGEEEFITLVDDHNEILDDDILTFKKPINDKKQNSKGENKIKKKSSSKKKLKNKNKKKNVKKHKKNQK